jgi:hypothetical protein
MALAFRLLFDSLCRVPAAIGGSGGRPSSKVVPRKLQTFVLIRTGVFFILPACSFNSLYARYRPFRRFERAHQIATLTERIVPLSREQAANHPIKGTKSSVNRLLQPKTKMPSGDSGNFISAISPKSAAIAL